MKVGTFGTPSLYSPPYDHVVVYIVHVLSFYIGGLEDDTDDTDDLAPSSCLWKKLRGLNVVYAPMLVSGSFLYACIPIASAR